MHNLAKKIYETLEDGVKLSSEDIQKFSNSLARTIANRLQDREERQFTIRFSNIGKPLRKLYYDYKNPKAFKPSGQLLLKFLYGDIIEELVIFLVEQAGYRVGNQQKEVTLKGIKGHMDCTINNKVADVKSASTFGFEKFRRHQLNDEEKDVFGYLGQISGYVLSHHNVSHEDNTHSGCFVVVNKESGEIIVDTYSDIELIDVEEKIDKIREALSKDNPPKELCYEPVEENNGNIRINKNCSYCEHKDLCFPDMRRFQYSTGVVEYIHIEKTPRVEEVFL